MVAEILVLLTDPARSPRVRGAQCIVARAWWTHKHAEELKPSVDCPQLILGYEQRWQWYSSLRITPVGRKLRVSRG